MEHRESIFLNVFYYKIIVLVIFISATTKYTSFIYDYGIYFAVIYGCGLLVYNTIKKKINYRKVDISLIVFVLCYFITTLINYESGIFKQMFVLLCCLMYFFSFFSADILSLERFRRENNIMMLIIIVFSFIIAIFSFLLLSYDIFMKTDSTYNLHGGNLFQFLGMYSGISTMAMMSGLSAICSFYFIICRSDNLNTNKKFVIFNIINFLIQDFILTLSYTSAGIVTFGSALFIGIVGYLLKRLNITIKLKYIFVVILSLCIVSFNYLIMDKIAYGFVDTFSSMIIENIGDGNAGGHDIKIEADNAAEGLFTSNGRLPIWKEAISQWKERPIFGIGYGSFYYKMPVEGQTDIEYIEYRNMHSGYIELLVVCGATGFICIIIFGGYYLFNLIKQFLKNKEYYNEIGIVMVIIYMCLYALINQLFILDRSINVFLLCTFLGISRKMILNKDYKLCKE